MVKKNPKSDLEKIVLAVQHRHDRFEEIIDYEIWPILDYLSKKRGNLKTQLENYLILRLVVYVEANLKSFVIWLIDSAKTPHVNKLFRDDLRIPVARLDEIKSGDFTKGGITAITFNFQDLDDINFVLSILFGVDCFSILKDLPNLPENPFLSRKTASKLSENWNEFENMFKLRHKIAHTYFEQDNTRKIKYFRMLVDVTELFVYSIIILYSLINQFRNGNMKKDPIMAEFIHKKLEEYKKLHP